MDVCKLNREGAGTVHSGHDLLKGLVLHRLTSQATHSQGIVKTENKKAAQQALVNRAKANSDAVKGTYVAGSCASIGAAGNVEMQGGAY